MKKKFTIEEKNEIVLLYLDGHLGRSQIRREFNISGDSVFHRWVKQFEKFGTCIDNRGKCTKQQNPQKGRPKKVNFNYQDMSKEQLIKELELRDELKNFLVYLNQQNKNTKQ